MSYDEDKALQKILDHLYKMALEQTYNNASAEEIVRDTRLSLRATKEQGNKAILHNWVIVDSRSDDGAWIIRINQLGIEKLKELEHKKIKTPQPAPTKNTSNSRRDTVIYIAVIVGMIAAFFVIFDSIETRINTLTENEIITEECISGEFDLTIINCEIGLQVSRPNVDWVFLIDQEYFKEKSLNENFSEKFGEDFNRLHFEEFGVEARQFDEIINEMYDEYQLGRIIIDNLKNAKITISVHKFNHPTFSDKWERQWEVEIESKKTNFEDVRGKISMSEDRTAGRLEMTFLINSLLVKSTNAVEIRDDKVYMVQTLFHDDEIRFENSKEEFNQVLDSIRYF